MHATEASSTDTGQLVARAKAGDRAAFDALVESYAGRVYNIALRITGSREEAQDCVQDAFVRAYSALRHFREEAAFSTWLYRVAVNVANDACRRLKSQPMLASELAGPGPDDPPPDLGGLSRDHHDADGADEHLIRAQKRQLVLAAVRSLPEHHRTVIVLCDLQGMSYEEAAQVMETRVGTVKSRLNRARLTLKERLEPHMELLRS